MAKRFVLLMISVDRRHLVAREFSEYPGDSASARTLVFLIDKKEKCVKRIVGRFVFPIAACMSVAIAVGQAQSLLTHHVRQATQDGSARSMGRLPATQTVDLVITLPLRNEDQLD
jgi:hypothetical protein